MLFCSANVNILSMVDSITSGSYLDSYRGINFSSESKIKPESKDYRKIISCLSQPRSDGKLKIFQLNQPARALSTLELKALIPMTKYIKGFIAKPHPDLKVPGRPICPFIPMALAKNSVWMHADPSTKPDFEQTKIKLDKLRAKFHKLEPNNGRDQVFKTIVISFPNLKGHEAGEFIDTIQRQTKIDFVKEGLMIGEFHEFNKTPSTHNPDFFPGRSPLPTLVIRNMIKNDLPFLTDPKYTPQERVEFLTAFLAKDFNRGNDVAREELERAKNELL